MNRNILITGGAGFIGAHLVRVFLAKSCHVTVIDNLSFGHKKFLPLDSPNLEFWEIDLRDNTKMMEILQKSKPEIVIHLAAIHFIPYCNKYPFETVEVNIMGTRNLLDCCAIVKPKFFFFSSSAAVYPVQNNPINENSKLAPMDIYGITKVCCEELSKLFHFQTGIQTVIGRLFNVYGPGETNPHVIPEIVRQLREGRRKIRLGNLDPKRDFIHINDLVNAIVAIIKCFKEGFGIFNIGSGKEYSILDIIKKFEKIIGQEISVELDKRRIRLIERPHLLADISKMRRQIGWSPQVPLNKGLEELLA